jgi:hypothetical protein
LTRDVRVDVSQIRDSAQLAEEAQIALAVGAFSTTTWSRQRLFHRPLASSEQLQIAISVDGRELGGTLELRTAVVLEQAAQGSEFTAHVPGSVLWEDRQRVRLQGDAPLFPISVVSFERAGFAPHAPWHLEIRLDLTAPLHASIRLYLNSAATSVVAAFANAATPTDEQRAILRAVYADVARLMVEHSLNQEELHRSDGDWEPDSLGYALKALLNRHYPGADLGAIQRYRVDHPTDFGTEILSKLRLFDV